jgi:hypothetical protein
MKSLFALMFATSAFAAGPSHLTIKFSKAVPENLCAMIEGKPEEFSIQPWEVRARSGDLLTITCEPTPKKSKNTQVSLVFKVENLGPGAHSHQYPWGKSANGEDKGQFADTGACQRFRKILGKVAKANAVFFENDIESADLSLDCVADKKWGTVLNFELQTIGK